MLFIIWSSQNQFITLLWWFYLLYVESHRLNWSHLYDIWYKWSINHPTDWAAQFPSKSKTRERSALPAGPLTKWSSYSGLLLITHPLCLMSCSTGICKCSSSQRYFLMAKSGWWASGSTACRSLRLPVSRLSRPTLLRPKTVRQRTRRSEII